MNDAGPDKTLVIQPLPGIGDMIWHLPFIHAIAQHSPAGRVSVLTKPRSHADRLFACDNAVEEVLWLERGRGRHGGILGLFRLAAELRRRRFSSVWILHQSPRYALIAWLAGIPQRSGYGTGRQAWFLTRGRHLPPHRKAAHPIESAQRLLERLGVPFTDPQPRLALGTELRARMREQWQPLEGGANIVLGIGSSESWKVWPRERFNELMQRLGELRACRFYLMGGGASEQRIAEAILEEAQAAGVNVVNALDRPLDEAVHLCSLCDLYIGNDTGLLNIAAAVGMPALGLFGASPPLDYSTLIHPVLPPAGACKGMDRSGQGMLALTVEQVLAQSVALLPDTGG